jgi:heat shock protein HtpX
MVAAIWKGMMCRINDNVLKLAMLLIGLSVLFLAAGQVLGGPSGMALAAVCALLLGGVCAFSDQLILRMSGARRLAPQEAGWLVQLIEDLARRAALPLPKIYIIESPTPNAFAIGRHPDHGAVVITSGLTRLLTRDELAGVIAHELAHIKHRDTLLSAAVATLAGTMAPLMVVTPLVALLIRLGMPRIREYQADELGASILGDPLPLASALEKIEWAMQQMPMRSNPAMAPLYFVHPLSDGNNVLRLFRTHPPTEHRIACLRSLAQRDLMGDV